MMNKQGSTPKWKRPGYARTKAAVQEALHDIRGATEPRIHNVRDGVTWVLALGAGAIVAWRGFQAAQEPLPDGSDNQTANVLAAAREHERRNPAQISKLTTPEPPARSIKARTTPTSSVPVAADAVATPKLETGLVPLAKEFYKRFNEDDVSTRASALAFVGVLSLVPLALFALITFGFVFRDPHVAAQHVQSIITQLLPGESAQKAANDVLQQTHLIETAQDMAKGAAFPLFIGVLSLVWAGISLLVTASAPMNAAWDVQETRGFVSLRLTALGVLVSAGLLFITSLGLTALPGLIRNLNLGTFGTLGDVPFWAQALISLSSLALGVGMFVLIYRFLPNAPVTWKAALFSGTVTGLLWALFKGGFALYLAHFGDSNNKLYGALGGVVLLITWIYYSCLVLLAGAEIGKMYHEHREEGGVAERPTT